MYGSSASNEYDSGGTENATGFSSKVRFESELLAVPGRNKPGAEFPAPSNPAPTILVFNKNLRRSMGTLAARRASRPAGRIIPLVPAGWEHGLGKSRCNQSSRVFHPHSPAPAPSTTIPNPLLFDAPKCPLGRFREDLLARSGHLL